MHCGHGSEKSICFGDTHRNNLLLLEDLIGKGIQKTGKFFEPNPTSFKNIDVILSNKGIGFKIEYDTKNQPQDIGETYSTGEKINN